MSHLFKVDLIELKDLEEINSIINTRLLGLDLITHTYNSLLTYRFSLMHHIDDFDLLPPQQSRFRKYHSTETAQLKIVSDALVSA